MFLCQSTADFCKCWKRLPTVHRCRNNLPYCALLACCPQNKSCRIVSHMGEGSFHALWRDARNTISLVLCPATNQSIVIKSYSEFIKKFMTYLCFQREVETHICVHRYSYCLGCRSQTQSQNSSAAAHGNSAAQSFGSCWLEHRLQWIPPCGGGKGHI